MLTFAFIVYAFGIMSEKIIAKTNFNELLPNIFFFQFYTINSYVWILHSFQVNWGAWCDIKAQFHCSVCEYLHFPATFVEDTILSSLGILVSLAKYSVQFSCDQLFATPWAAEHQVLVDSICQNFILGFLFCSICWSVYFCASTIQFLLLWLCSIVWN